MATASARLRIFGASALVLALFYIAGCVAPHLFAGRSSPLEYQPYFSTPILFVIICSIMTMFAATSLDIRNQNATPTNYAVLVATFVINTIGIGGVSTIFLNNITFFLLFFGGGSLATMEAVVFVSLAFVSAVIVGILVAANNAIGSQTIKRFTIYIYDVWNINLKLSPFIQNWWSSAESSTHPKIFIYSIYNCNNCHWGYPHLQNRETLPESQSNQTLPQLSHASIGGQFTGRVCLLVDRLLSVQGTRIQI